MKNVLYFILGIILIISVSSTTVSTMTIKPALPKSVIVSELHKSDVTDFTYKYVKRGYKIHTVSAPNSNGTVLVVMEKY